VLPTAGPAARRLPFFLPSPGAQPFSPMQTIRVDMRYHIGVKCRLDAPDGRPILGEGRAELLELVDELGSLSEAARQMGMSYRYAWGVVRKMTDAAGEPVVESTRGGSEGGRTVLTPAGRELMDAFRRVEDALQEEARRGAFPHPRLTVDALAVRDGRVLLVRRGRPPFEGDWALPGGFVERGERLEEAVMRELAEETGATGRLVGIVGTYSRPDRDPRGHTISVVYAIEVEEVDVRGGDDASEAAWHDVGSPPRLAFDHGEILTDFRERGYLRISKDG
jgi:8-oxo-dGTP diphosphatase